MIYTNDNNDYLRIWGGMDHIFLFTLNSIFYQKTHFYFHNHLKSKVKTIHEWAINSSFLKKYLYRFNHEHQMNKLYV